MLGLVQRIVDAAEEGIGAGIARAVEYAEAQAGGEAQGLLLCLEAVLGQLQAELLAQLPGVLQGITPVPFHLVQQVVQDEACGLGGGPQEPMRLPISLQSAW